MKKVMCFGTFDGVHKGHEYYLKKAKQSGDYLVVVVALDQTVEAMKKKNPIHPAEERAEEVRKLKIADKVVLGNTGDKLQIVIDEKPDIICLGYDQTFFTEKLKEKLQEKGLNPKILRIDSFMPEVYKSSKIKKSLMK